MMQGPSSFVILQAQQVIITGTINTGLFVYNGPRAKGNLIAEITPPGVTSDGVGNTIPSSGIFNAGVWNASGTLLQHFGINNTGTVFIVGPDGVTRIQINNGTGGTGPDVRFFNDFGAVILVIDPSQGGTFQYQDNNSAVQGSLIGYSGGKNAVDPINGTSVPAGIKLIDPAFGDTLTALGANIALGQLAFTANALITANTGSGATSPYFSVAGPEQGHAGHAVLRVYGTSADGTIGGGVIISNTDPPVRALVTELEVQGAIGMLGVGTPVAPVAGNGIKFADTSGMPRWLTGLAGDTDTYGSAQLIQQVSPRSQSFNSSVFANVLGLSKKVGIGTYVVKCRLIIEWNSNADTPQMRFAGPAISQYDVSFGSKQSGTNNVNNVANTVAAGTVNGTGYNGGAINVTGPMTAAGVFFDMDIWGMFTFTAAGTLTLQAAEFTGANPWLVFSGMWEVVPR